MEIADLALGTGPSATSQLTMEKEKERKVNELRSGEGLVHTLFLSLPAAPPVEMSPEALTEQVESERVDAGRGEAEDAGQQGYHQVAQRQVHLLVVEGAVHVEQVVGEPAEGEEEDQHQHNLGQPLPGLHL